MGTYSEEQKAEAIVNGITKAVDWAFEGVGLALGYKKQTSNKKPEAWGKTAYDPSALSPGHSESSSEKNNIPTSGNLGTNGFGTCGFDDLMESINGVTTKLRESIAAWGAQTAAKIADKAEDAAIIALYAVDYVKQFGALITQLAASTAAWVANTAAKVASTAAEWAHIAATTAWTAIATTATAVTTAFNAAMAVLTSPITLVVAAIGALIAVVVLLVKNWDTVKGAAISVWETIKETFSNAWSWFKATVVDPLVNGFKGAANGIIGFVNGLIAGVVKGINSIIGVINKLHFTIPDWIPGLGGETFGFHLKTLNTPQIPYLAKGAVLPANKPFLAMVGDQRHGTNIEAPLATIQEAVAMVTADQTQAILAGFESSIGVQREILEAVLGICIGDDVIGNAVARYKRKQAVIRGGAL
jgi:hypothetical protein